MCKDSCSSFNSYFGKITQFSGLLCITWHTCSWFSAKEEPSIVWNQNKWFNIFLATFTSSHPSKAVGGEPFKVGKSVYAWHWQKEADINTHSDYKENGDWLCCTKEVGHKYYSSILICKSVWYKCISFIIINSMLLVWFGEQLALPNYKSNQVKKNKSFEDKNLSYLIYSYIYL